MRLHLLLSLGSCPNVRRMRSICKKGRARFHTLKDMEPANGLFPYFLKSSADGTLRFENKEISFGPYGDSFYEYQL